MWPLRHSQRGLASGGRRPRSTVVTAVQSSACLCSPFTDGETEAPQGQMTSHPPTATPQAIRLPAEDSYSLSSDFRICKVPELLQIESSLDAQISKPVKSRTALMDAGVGEGELQEQMAQVHIPSASRWP